MQSIGERLEEARKRRGISIREAAETTKIRSDFLARFEESNFDINLPEIYVRGFLRNYARFLRINPETIVTDYTSTLLGETKSRKETRELFGRMEIQERPKPPEPSHSHEENDPHPEPSRPAAAPKPPGPPAGSRGDWKDLVRLDNTVYLKIGGIILSGILAIAVLVWVIQAIVGSGGNSRADNENGTVTAVDSETINLIALEEVRVKVTEIDGGDVLFQGPLARGETRSVTKRGTILITYTAGANLLVEKGGQRFRMPTDGIGRSTFN
ncbi:MAG: helix-turn-helix domain-containing protein [Opitutaceae bacterium]